jgi:hypothetical protein
VLRPPQEVLLEQIVGDRRLDFDAREERIERRRHDFACAERRRAQEDDLPVERAGLQPAIEDIDRRHVRERLLAAAVSDEQIAAAVERHVS